MIARSNLVNEMVICRTKHSGELNLPSNEYAVLRGPEVLVECAVSEFKGNAFSPYPLSYEGSLGEMINSIDLNNIGWRGVFFATLNALLTMMGIIDGGEHCIGNEPELCGVDFANYLLENFGKQVSILHIGYQPGHVKALANRFSKLYVTDLDREVVGSIKYGVEVIDGSRNRDLINRVDIVLITASAIVNKTIYDIIEQVYRQNKTGIIYGVSAKGAYAILKNRFREFANMGYFCPYTRSKQRDHGSEYSI